jgi:deoxycytidine triphosphate deaminase
MILTGHEITSEITHGRIVIHPFLPGNVNPNSYNFRVGNTLRVYRDEVIDPRCRPDTELVTMPESGYVLEAQRLGRAAGAIHQPVRVAGRHRLSGPVDTATVPGYESPHLSGHGNRPDHVVEATGRDRIV